MITWAHTNKTPGMETSERLEAPPDVIAILVPVTICTMR
jgi:hypothetical protein